MKDEKNIKYKLLLSILIAIGPMLLLFIKIFDKNNENILLNIASVIFVLTFVFYYLRKYLKVYNKNHSMALNFLSYIVSFIYYILLIALIVIPFLGFNVVINILQEKIFIKEEYLIYITKYPYLNIFYVILVIVVTRLDILPSGNYKLFSKRKGIYSWLKIDKYLILIIMLLIYILVTSVVVVTKNGIYDYSFYNLKGNKYSFSDVEYVKTGFVNRGKNKGEFFYDIEMKNGKKLNFCHPALHQVSDKYNDDIWQEYVDIDKYIMNSGAKKVSSEKGSKYVEMDKVYIDKLLRVVRNK